MTHSTHTKARALCASRPNHRAALLALCLALATGATACAGTPTAEPITPPPPPPPPPAEHIPPPAEEVTEESPVIILSDVGFKTPESVYFDKAHDVYFVSNINGAPLDVDDNGFISKLYYDGTGKLQIDLKFIDGASDKFTLNAPKGLTVAGNTLYVADIDHVRMFNAETGAFEGELAIKGATFLNDVATGKNDQVYVSDSGLDAKFETTKTDAIYRIENGKAKKLIKSPSLGAPNGVLAAHDGVWVTTFGSGELYFVSDKGKKSHVQKLPKGQNDGIIYTEDGRLLISSWEDKSVFAGPYQGPFTVEISGVESPADIGYDCTRNKVLIPLFMKDTVIIHKLSDKPPATPPTSEDAAEPAPEEAAADAPTEVTPNAGEVLPSEEAQ